MESGQGGRGGQKRPKMGGRPLYKPPNVACLCSTSVLLCKMALPTPLGFVIVLFSTSLPPNCGGRERDTK